MKKKVFIQARWLLCSLLAVFLSTNVWAEESVYKQTTFAASNQSGNSSYSGTFTNTTEGFAVTVGNANNNNNNWSGHIKMGSKSAASTGYIKTDNAIDKAITKVELNIEAITATNVTSITLYTSADGSIYSSVGDFSKEQGAQSVTIASPTNNLYYKIEVVCTKASKNGIIELSEVKYYAEDSGSGETAASVTPNPAGADVEMEGVTNQTISLTYDNIENYIAAVTLHSDAAGNESFSDSWLTASIDETDYATVTYSVTANDGAARTAYIKVYAIGDNEKEATVIIPVTQAKYSAPTGTFELFSGDIEEGDYVIVSTNALSNSVNNNRIASETVTISDDKITNPDANIIWHIAASGDYWTLYNEVAGKYAASNGTKNQAALLSDISGDNEDKALWSVSGTEAFEFVNKKNQSSSVNANLRYNSQNAENSRFACYSTSTGGALSLYKKQVAGQPKAPTFSVEGGNYESAQSVELSCETDGATIYYTTNGDAPTSSSTQYNGTAIAVDHTMTIKAIAIKNEISSTVASATYTIIVWQTVADVWDDITADGPTNAHIYGYVSQINVGGYDNNFYISDNGSTEGNQLYAYRMDMNNFTVKVGDKVKLAGDLTIHNELKEFKYTSATDCGKVMALEAKGALQSVAVSGTPTKTQYAANETFDPAGLKVYGTYANGFVGEITEGITWSNDLTDNKVTESTTVHVTATVSEITSPAYDVPVTVAAKTLVSIAVGTASYTIYTGEVLPKPVVTATFSEGDPEDVSTLAVYDTENVFDTELIDNPNPQTITVAYTFGGETKTATYTVSVKDYANDVDHPYTVAEAISIITNAIGTTASARDIYVQGIVCQKSNPSSNSQTYYISDDGTTTTKLEIYKGKYFDGGNFTNANQVLVNDEVVVGGKVKMFNSTPEFDTGSALQSLARTPNFTITDVASFEVGAADLAVADLTITQDGEGAVTLANSNNTDAVTIVDGNLHAVAAGTATITANLAADGIYKAATADFEVTVIAAQVKYAITFDGNGADGGSAPAAIADKAAGADVTLPANAYTYTGHSFNGWKVINITTSEEVEVVAGVFTMPASAVTIQAQWAEISVWAYTYTSNVTLTDNSTNKCYSEGVTIETVDYDGLRIATGSAAGSATVTVPAHATKLHFHVAGWKGVSGSIDVKLGETTLATITLIADDGINQSNNNTAPYTLENDPIGYYYSVNIPDSESPTDIEFSAASGKRAVIFGVNQEGGVLPVLDHITITGTMTNTTGWKTGDNIVPEGLTVNAIYTLNAEEQTPVDVTSSVVWSHEALVENQTEVTLTATYTDDEVQKTANVNVTIDAVETGESIISTDANNRYWTVDKDAVAENKTFAVTLINVVSATATLGGTNPEAFTIDKTALVDGDVITISVVSTATVGTFDATITISDDASVAEDKVVNVSLTVNEPEVEETAVSTTSEWIAAADADLVDGAQVLIAGVKDEVTYAMGQQNNNNRAAVEATVSEGVLTPGEGTMSFTLVAQDGGTFALRTSNGKYLYAASSGNNYMRTQDDIDENAKWTITATSASAEGSSNRHLMRFNANSMLFSCYSSGQAAIAFYVPKPAVTPEPVYTEVRNGLAIGRFYTICLNKEFSAVRGATLWDIENGNNDEITLIEAVLSGNNAGKPYIFLATAATMEVVYGENTTTTASSKNGLHGTFVTLTETELDGKYILSENQLWYVDVTGGSANVTLAPYRAYLNKSEVPDQSAEGDAPARRRMVMAINNPSHTPTGIDVVNMQAEGVQKVVIDGNLYIVRDGRMYDTTGRLVK